MNHRTLGKILAAIIFSLLAAIYFYSDHVKRGQLGREEFLAQQELRFRKYFERPKPFALDLLNIGIEVGAAIGGYELLALGLSAILKPRGNRSNAG